MIHLKRTLALIFTSATLFLGCQKPQEEAFDVNFNVPAEVSISSEDTEMSFVILFGKAPKMSDVIVMSSTSAGSHDCAIKSVGEKKFTVALWKGISSGKYTVSVKRDGKTLEIGAMELTVVRGGDIKPDAGVTVYGVVTCDNQPVADVVVSDGVLVTKTNDKGVYQLKSEKKYGTVFMSVPEGYEALLDGILPSFWKKVNQATMSAQRLDFELMKVDNQNFTLYVVGDMHLANRTGDIGQFRTLMNDWQTTVSATSGPQYGLTLGDMTWDIYWYQNNFMFGTYKDEINKDIKGISLYHTMGNHDNDYRKDGDFDKEISYRENLCPTFYSTNIGKFHVIVLDNIDYTNVPHSEDDAKGSITTDHRGEYAVDFPKEMIEWMKKDLAYVSKNTPLIITSHAPTHMPASATTFSDRVGGSNGGVNTANFVSLLSGYKVHFFSGHTHNMFGYERSSSYYETNCGSACGSWWWSGYLTPGINLSQDGTPGGYMIVKATGTDLTWQYKSGGYPISHQFRSYDMNEVKKVVTPELGASRAKWQTYVDNVKDYAANTVLINVWDYDAKWKVSVTEDGKEVTATPVRAYDPLHMIALSAKRFQSAENPSFTTSQWSHFFLVKCSSASSTLQIKVTDRFGNEYTETMKRPKAFSTDAYKK